MQSSLTKQDVLRAFKGARALLTDRSNWTRNTLARTKSSHETEPNSPNAARFCALGALQRNGLPISQISSLEIDYMLGYEVDSQLPMINDRLAKSGGGHKAILARFDEDIAKLEAEILAETPKPEKIERAETPEVEEVAISA